MPRKTKPRKPVASPREVWIAPRPANTSGPRTFEPSGVDRSNRYLEFADIALGTKIPSRHKKKIGSTAGRVQRDQHLRDQNPRDQHPRDQHPEAKLTPINSPRTSNPRGPNQGFGAFRNPR